MPLYCNGINDRYIRSACVICPFKELKQIHSRRFPSGNIFSQKSKWICVLNVPDMLIISLAFLLFTVNCAIALQFSFVWVKRCRLTNQFGCRLNYWTSLKKKIFFWSFGFSQYKSVQNVYLVMSAAVILSQR